MICHAIALILCFFLFCWDLAVEGPLYLWFEALLKTIILYGVGEFIYILYLWS